MIAATGRLLRVLTVFIWVFPAFVIAGPKLGDGPRWNLGRAVEGKKRVEKEDVERELLLMEERSGRLLTCAKRTLENVQSEIADEAWEEIVDMAENPEDLARILEVEAIGGAATTRAYIQQLEQENRILREGSDARCTRMLQQALEGSDDADVDFVFDSGQMGVVKGHRGMLCAGSEEYAGLFRSGMVEAQEGKIRVPPCVGMASFRGFLEWLYLGEFFVYELFAW
jgi:hypothetical protein